ncbi:hypothetical protein ACLB2K_033815 [Fragaria x ananassa]
MEETRRDCYRDEYDYAEEEFQSRRGRERMSRMPSRHVNASIRKGTRSLSPLRIPDIMFDDVVSPAPTTSHASNSSIKPATSPSVSSAYNTILSAISFSKVNKKWKLRDMLLFRSASEGRATTGKDPLRKYSLLSTKKSMSEDVKNSSFRSTDSVGSVSSRRRGPVSPHELHYTVNRAVTEEMRRKTVLPYKHGLLGCLGFNHGLHEISRVLSGQLAAAVLWCKTAASTSYSGQVQQALILIFFCWHCVPAEGTQMINLQALSNAADMKLVYAGQPSERFLFKILQANSTGRLSNSIKYCHWLQTQD